MQCERAYLQKMEGGCHIPIFGLATVVGDSISINGGVASLDGKQMILEEVSGQTSEATTLGQALAQLVINNGGHKIIHG